MTVSTINNWFERIGRFQINHRGWFLAGIILITLAGFFGVPHLVFEDDTERWLTTMAEQKAHKELFKELFGNQDAVGVLVEADNVFDPEVLDAIERLSARLEAEVPFADEVTSLTRLSVSMGVEDGIRVMNPFEDGIPGRGKPLAEMTAEERAELAEKKAFIMSRESLVNNIVSDDATETWVILSLLPFDDDRGDMYVVGNAAIPIVEADEFKSDAYTFKGTGTSYTETEEQAVVAKETALRVISGFIVMILCLILFVRSLRGLIVPVIATIGGIGTVLGFSGWLGIYAEPNLATLPILLGMALAVGYAVHYINGFRYEFRSVSSRREAAILAVKTTGWPILFTVITTMASFVSFMGVGIDALKWVGGISSCIVFTVFVYVIVLLPILYSFGKDADSAENAHKQLRRARFEKVDLLYTRFGESVLKYRIAIVAASIVIGACSIFGLLKITVNIDYIDMMGNRIPYVARIITIMNAKLGNQYSYDVMIEYPDEDAFKDPQIMRALDDLGAELGKLRSTKISGTKPRVTSVTDIVKEMNRTLNADDSAYYTIPEEQDYLAQLLFLYEISGGNNLSQWVSEDYSTAHIHVEMKKYDANAINADIMEVQQLAKHYFPGAQTSCIGDAIIMASMNHTLVTSEIKSLGGSFAIILLILIIAFASVRTGLIGMVPNVAPALLVGGLMGLCRFPLDMLTMTIMPMILGIAVDDTIHFTNHVKYEFELTHNYHDAIINSFVKIGRSMLATTVILCAMFTMYMFSPLMMLFRVGLLATIGLFAALVADYTLTPALLYMTKPLGAEHK
ncbi:MAG: MMPL family transporter [Treponema sp.]|nr:MMPL family transporter [Treponema sp.]